MTDDLDQYLQEKRLLVERRLSTLLQPSDGTPPALVEAMRYSVLSPGKRLRPLLVVLAAEACSGRDVDALAAACALEMVHVYSLIHDDLPAMDDDDLRRGQPTCHKKFGEALAILAGDALLTLAFQTLSEAYPAATAAASCLELARAAGAAGMVGGQVEDLAWECDSCYAESGANDAATRRRGDAVTEVVSASPRLRVSASQVEALDNIHARKTGALFRAGLRLGVLVVQGEREGGPEGVIMNSLDAYGRCFGLAFQITDDLLDIEGTAAVAGKRVQKDAARGKLTYPGFWGVDESRLRVRQLCQQACTHLQPLGRAGDRLQALVASVVERSR